MMSTVVYTVLILTFFISFSFSWVLVRILSFLVILAMLQLGVKCLYMTEYYGVL